MLNSPCDSAKVIYTPGVSTDLKLTDMDTVPKNVKQGTVTSKVISASGGVGEFKQSEVMAPLS